MSASPSQTTHTTQAAPWLPLVVVVLTQIQASFAVNALTVSMEGITSDLSTPATSVGTAITAGTFAMAAFILLGAKVGARYGSRTVFQVAVAIHALAMAGVALSQSPAMLFVAQASSGAVIALIAAIAAATAKETRDVPTDRLGLKPSDKARETKVPVTTG